MNFPESERYLLSLGNEVSAMKLGLENITRLLTALGDPQKKYFKVQVAGTNGKGSVCAFLDSICNSAGVGTGRFTSPHLVSITERISINGVNISEEQFAKLSTNVRAVAEDLITKERLSHTPTFFEQVTAIALLAFAEAKVALAILETGLGGRLDATTAANAEIAAITQIDYDHQEYLGDTLEQIAAEKAAIIHRDSVVVTAEQDPRAQDVIRARCREMGVQPLTAPDIIVTHGSGWLNFATTLAEYRVPKLGLLGDHQVSNAKVAILVAEVLQEHFPITARNIIDGLERARHPGRLEYQGEYLFDGAHNPAGAEALASFLDEYEPRPVTLVFGAMAGKDIGPMATALFARADTVILTQPDNSRALRAEEIKSAFPGEIVERQILLTSTVSEAMTLARELKADNGIIVITGSLYLVGEAKKILNN